MTQPTVFLSRTIPSIGLEILKGTCRLDIWPGDFPPSRTELLDRVAGRDALLCLLSDSIDAQVMDVSGPRLKVISNYAVGYDNIDVYAATKRGILVTNTPGVLTETTADLAFALLLAAARRILEGASVVRDGKWTSWGPELLLGRDVYGATLGIIGMGRIGEAMTRRARGFDMDVIYLDHGVDHEELQGAARCASLDELLSRADFVSLHVPLTAETRHMIDENALRRMKPSAVLVNTARGAIVDTAALYRALRSGEIAYAALDVTDPEPLPLHHELLSLSNCIVVPHMGSGTIATRGKMAEMAAQNIISALRGEVPLHLVNPEVLPHRR